MVTTCGSQYGVFVGNGKWAWFSDYRQASRVEAEQLYGKVRRKLASSGTVILTADMAKQVENARGEERVA